MREWQRPAVSASAGNHHVMYTGYLPGFVAAGDPWLAQSVLSQARGIRPRGDDPAAPHGNEGSQQYGCRQSATLRRAVASNLRQNKIIKYSVLAKHPTGMSLGGDKIPLLTTVPGDRIPGDDLISISN